MAGRYLPALLGWLAGGLAAPVVMTAGLIAIVDAICKGTSDCSWGFELLLVVPVLLLSFFVVGPRLVERLSRRAVAPPQPGAAARWTRVGAAGAIVLLYLGGGSGSSGFFLMLLVVALGVPALVAWRA